MPSVFGEWVRDHRGRLWVAVLEGRVVGVAKLTLGRGGEAWLHGLRVHPDHRRRGIATALLEHRLARARRLGASVARLDTSEDNAAVQRLMRHYGFRRIARMAYYEAPARDGVRPHTAQASDSASLWRLLRTGDGMLYESHFARGLAREDVTRAIRQRGCLAVGPAGHPAAVALVEMMPGNPRSGRGGSRLLARVIAGRPAAARDLLRALRAEARARGLTRSGIAAPERFWRPVREAGYRRRWPETMNVFERRLT